MYITRLNYDTSKQQLDLQILELHIFRPGTQHILAMSHHSQYGKKLPRGSFFLSRYSGASSIEKSYRVGNGGGLYSVEVRYEIEK